MSAMPGLSWLLPAIVLWLLLTDASPASWIIGIPFIALAFLMMPHGRVGSSGKFSFMRLPVFLWHFLVESLRGGVDVSQRVLSREQRLSPGFFDYPVRLQSPTARRLFISCINLLPGTLCADWHDGVAHIHALDRGPATLDDLRVFEQTIGRLFGEPL